MTMIDDDGRLPMTDDHDKRIYLILLYFILFYFYFVLMGLTQFEDSMGDVMALVDSDWICP